MARRSGGSSRAGDVKAFGGTWRIAELEGFDREYIELTGPPLVRLRVSRRGEVDGSFAFGAQESGIDGRIERSDGGPPRMTFTFEGVDEGDMVHGCGYATLFDQDTLRGELRYHLSDTIRFTWRRERTEAPAGGCG